jgi:hypothetical protein
MGKKPAPKAKAAAGAVAPPPDETSQKNRELYHKLQDDLAVIKGHPLFKDIESADAAVIDAKNKEFSGHQAPFDATACAMALTSQGKYKCGANLFWINQLWTAAPSVPINPASVDRLAAYYLDQPAAVPMDLVIAVPGAAFKPDEHRGGMQCVSPDEVRLAYFGAMAHAVRECQSATAGGLTPATTSALTLKVKQWRHHALSCTFEFRVLGSADDIYFAAVNLREKLVTDYSTLAMSAYQRIFQVLAVKARKEEILGPLTAARVAEEFNKHAQLAADSEEVTVDAVGQILAIHQHALKVPEIVEVIELCERRFLLKSPFNSITKLHHVVRQAKGPLNPPPACCC